MNIIAMMYLAVICILLGYVLATVPEFSVRREREGQTNRRSTKTEKSPRVLSVLILIVSLIFIRDVIVGVTPFGSTTIGGVMEKREYTETYYVFAFPEGSGAMNYRVKAQIHSYMKNEGLTSDRFYELVRLFWPDGGTIMFTDQAGNGYSLEPYSIVEVTDNDGRKWHIELTGEKAK